VLGFIGENGRGSHGSRGSLEKSVYVRRQEGQDVVCCAEYSRYGYSATHGYLWGAPMPSVAVVLGRLGQPGPQRNCDSYDLGFGDSHQIFAGGGRKDLRDDDVPEEEKGALVGRPSRQACSASQPRRTA
jgi:hypothetical protein